MLAFFEFTKRNIFIYLRNKSTVMFSFLSMFIIIGLYVLFLGQAQIANIKQLYGDINGIELLIHYWIMGGILAVNAVNVTMATLTVMAADKEKGYIKDFNITPLKRSQVILGYIASAIIVGFFMSLISLIIAEGFILMMGGQLLTVKTHIKIIIGLFTSVTAIASIFFLVFSFIKSEQAVSIVSTVVGTFVGFMAGIYIPLSVLPDLMQKLVRVFPLTYSASMMKLLFTQEQVKQVFGSNQVNIDDYNNLMSNSIIIKGHEVSYLEMNLVLIVTAILFFFISYIVLKRKER